MKIKNLTALLLTLALLFITASAEGGNLLINSASPTLAAKSDFATGTWRIGAQQGTGSREIADIDAPPVEGILQGIRVYDDGTSDKPSSVALDNVPVESGYVYVLSCYARGSGSLIIQAGNSPYQHVFHDVSDEWQQYSFAFKVDGSIGFSEEDTGIKVFFGLREKREGDITICGMQLEEATAHVWSTSEE